MRSRWLMIGVSLLLGGCTSVVEMAHYKVTSIPEVSLKASTAKPARVRFVANTDDAQPIVAMLETELRKHKAFSVVDEGADYWFVLGCAQQYAKGKPFHTFKKGVQESEAGGSDVIVEETVNQASAAKSMGVAVYETKNLAPVYYFEVPLYDGEIGTGTVKSKTLYSDAFSKDVVERFMDVFVQRQKDIETPIPVAADAELRRLFKAGDYHGFFVRYKALGCIDLSKYCETLRKIEAGTANDAEKAQVKDAEVRFANYYLYLLVREALVMDPDRLEKTRVEHLQILEALSSAGLVDSVPVALARIEHKLNN